MTKHELCGTVVLITNETVISGVFDPRHWGWSSQATADPGNRLRDFWARYRTCFKTKTRDASEHAWTSLRELLSTNSKRTFANIARRVIDPDDNGQKVQHFTSDSPWLAQPPLQQVQREIAKTPALATGGVRILAESPDENAGPKSAGAGRQHNGRLGNVAMRQVGTFLACFKEPVWTWVDGELFLPEPWFAPERAAERQGVGMPPERSFATKIELGWR